MNYHYSPKTIFRKKKESPLLFVDKHATSVPTTKGKGLTLAYLARVSFSKSKWANTILSLPDLVPLKKAFEEFYLISFIFSSTLFLPLDILELFELWISIFIFLMFSSMSNSISLSFRSEILLSNPSKANIFFPVYRSHNFPYLIVLTKLISIKIEPSKIHFGLEIIHWIHKIIRPVYLNILDLFFLPFRSGRLSLRLLCSEMWACAIQRFLARIAILKLSYGKL